MSLLLLLLLLLSNSTTSSLAFIIYMCTAAEPILCDTYKLLFNEKPYSINYSKHLGLQYEIKWWWKSSSLLGAASFLLHSLLFILNKARAPWDTLRPDRRTTAVSQDHSYSGFSPTCNRLLSFPYTSFSQF